MQGYEGLVNSALLGCRQSDARSRCDCRHRSNVDEQPVKYTPSSCRGSSRARLLAAPDLWRVLALFCRLEAGFRLCFPEWAVALSCCEPGMTLVALDGTTDSHTATKKVDKLKVEQCRTTGNVAAGVTCGDAGQCQG